MASSTNAWEMLLDSLTGSSTVSLRLIAVYFTQHLPLGPRFLPTIYACFAIYLISILARQYTRRPSKILPRSLILIFGLYDSRRWTTSLAGILTNFIAFLACLDFVFRAHILNIGQDISFSQIGYTDASTTRVVIRSPNTTAIELRYRIAQSDKWTRGQVLPVTEENDFVVTYLLSSLKADTLYEYQTNLSHLGSFKTTSSPLKKWTMVSSSCLKPGYPYRPLGDPLRVRGLEHLSQFIETKATEFVLFLGDFIYIDLPIRFGFNNEDYRKAYRQGNANPVAYSSGKTWYDFKRGDVDFFVADTRRYRSIALIPDGPEKTMLGTEQLEDLYTWLHSGNNWKVFVSSVPFTRNWRGPEANDSWAGYLWERERILEQMWTKEGVIIISGDRHEHATTEFPSLDGTQKVTEFSTSPLSQFYQPFERMYEQIERSDIQVHYHPWGNSKFGAFTFDTSAKRKQDRSLKFELFVDGAVTWEKIVTPFSL